MVGQDQPRDRDHHPPVPLPRQVQQRFVLQEVQERQELRDEAPPGDRHQADPAARQAPGHFLLVPRQPLPGLSPQPTPWLSVLTALGRRPTQSYSGGFSLATDAPPARLTVQTQQVVLNPWIPS